MRDARNLIMSILFIRLFVRSFIQRSPRSCAQDISILHARARAPSGHRTRARNCSIMRTIAGVARTSASGRRVVAGLGPHVDNVDSDNNNDDDDHDHDYGFG